MGFFGIITKCNLINMIHETEIYAVYKMAVVLVRKGQQSYYSMFSKRTVDRNTLHGDTHRYTILCRKLLKRIHVTQQH